MFLLAKRSPLQTFNLEWDVGHECPPPVLDVPKTRRGPRLPDERLQRVSLKLLSFHGRRISKHEVLYRISALLIWKEGKGNKSMTRTFTMIHHPSSSSIIHAIAKQCGGGAHVLAFKKMVRLQAGVIIQQLLSKIGSGPRREILYT